MEQRSVASIFTQLARAQQEEAEGRARMVSQIMKVLICLLPTLSRFASAQDLHASRAESEKYKAEAETSGTLCVIGNTN
jgi:hypothetical protein